MLKNLQLVSDLQDAIEPEKQQAGNRRNHWFISVIIPIVLVLFSTPLDAQQPQHYAAVTYLKTNPGKKNAFLSLVKSTNHKLFEGMVNDKKIFGWYLYEVLLAEDQENSYDYVAVVISTNFEGMVEGPGFNEQLYQATIKGSSPEKFQQFLTTLAEVRKVVKREIYAHRAGIDPKTPVSPYVQVDYMKPLPGKTADYVKTERDVFYPIHLERMKLGALTDWGLYEKLLPFNSHSDFDFVTANFFNSLKSLIDPKYEEAFNHIPNSMDFVRMSEKVDEVRKLVRSETWKLVDHVDNFGKN